jgi:hypothetical protein
MRQWPIANSHTWKSLVLKLFMLLRVWRAVIVSKANLQAGQKLHVAQPASFELIPKHYSIDLSLKFVHALPITAYSFSGSKGTPL